MRATFLPLLAALATRAFANGTSIVNAIHIIGNSTAALSSSVTEFQSQTIPVGIFAILQDQKKLSQDLADGYQTASASAPLDLTEALNVYVATQALVQTVNETLANIANAKPKFDELLIASPLLLHDLQQDKAAADKFGQAVVSKVPDAGKPLATPLLAQIDAAFDKAIATYNSGGLSLLG